MDTIYALSSGAVPSGVAVVRISGPGAGEALAALAGALPRPRIATLRQLCRPGECEVIDEALALWFPAPASFTGEDCAEVHVHGGRAVLASLFGVLQGLGVRMAEPGEFTRRAFLNGKLDLTEAEGLADLVAAETEVQRRQAVRQAGGKLNESAAGWQCDLVALRAALEARLDFADEGDVAEALPAWYREILARVVGDMERALAGAAAGERVRDGFRVAIVGRPNAGKSSLLNALARRDVAIVTPEPGTTRDVLEVPLDLGGYPILLFDTAGIREADSIAEQEGIRRARLTAAEADLVLCLIEPGEAEPDLPVTDGKVLTVRTKADLYPVSEYGPLSISSKTGAGLAGLEMRLQNAAAAAMGNGSALVVRQRQREAIGDALRAMQAAAVQDDEIAADLLRSAADAIGRLTGRVGVEQVLDRVFQDFCIGK